MTQNACRSVTAIIALIAGLSADADTILVSNRADETVGCYDLESGTLVRTIETGLGAHEFAVSPDGATLIGSCYGSGPNHQVPDRRLFTIDLRAPDRITVLDLGNHPRPNDLRFLPGGDRVVVTSEQRDRLLIVDLTSGRIEQEIPLRLGTGHMLAVSADGARAYVPNVASGAVAVIDLLVTPPARIGSVASARGAEGVDVTPDGRWLWVACHQSSRIDVIDTASLEVAASIPADGHPFRVRCLPDGATVAVSHPGTGEVRLYDVATRVCRSRVAVGAGPTSLAVSTDGARVYVVCAGSNEVVGIDVATASVVDRLATGSMPDALAITERSVPAG